MLQKSSITYDKPSQTHRVTETIWLNDEEFNGVSPQEIAAYLHKELGHLNDAKVTFEIIHSYYDETYVEFNATGWRLATAEEIDKYKQKKAKAKASAAKAKKAAKVAS